MDRHFGANHYIITDLWKNDTFHIDVSSGPQIIWSATAFHILHPFDYLHVNILQEHFVFSYQDDCDRGKELNVYQAVSVTVLLVNAVHMPHSYQSKFTSVANFIMHGKLKWTRALLVDSQRKSLDKNKRGNQNHSQEAETKWLFFDKMIQIIKTNRKEKY